MLSTAPCSEYARELKYISDLQLWVSEEKRENAKKNCSGMAAVPLSVLQSKGLAVLDLKVQSVSPGLGSKRLVEVVPSISYKKVSSGKFKVGSAIVLTSHKVKKFTFKYDDDDDDYGDNDDRDTLSTSGVITKLSDKVVTLALDDSSLELSNMPGLYDMTQNCDLTAYNRMGEALSAMNSMIKYGLAEGQDTVLSPLSGSTSLTIKLLSYDASTFACNRDEISSDIELFDTNLNPSQVKAVLRGIEADYVSMIHGPPGTGKSATLVELIRQLVKLEVKILVCGPSNGAVDNLLERLSDYDIRCLRFGNPSKIQIDKVRKHSLAVKIEESSYGPELNCLRKRIDTIKADRKKRIYCSVESRQALTAAFKTKEAEAISQLLSESQVVFSTLNGVGARDFQGENFDVLIIDEATQALEPDCWVAILHCKKVILAGDHHQLPPTVLSNKTGLEVTLFQRLWERHGQYISTMLTTQYRMHQDIMEFSSKELYGSELVAHGSVKSHLLEHLPGIRKDIALPPITFIDTAGLGYHESSSNQSKSNEGECKLTDDHLNYLISSGLPQKDIAVISPYNAQVSLIKKKLGSKYQNVDIGSVDGFQGREKEAVIISLVRSNSSASVGFLKDYRRLNVAITRARRHLYIIGDSETTMSQIATTNDDQIHSEFLYKLGKYLTARATIEYPAPLDGKEGEPTYALKKSTSSQKRNVIPVTFKIDPEALNRFFSNLESEKNPTGKGEKIPDAITSFESPSATIDYPHKKLSHTQPECTGIGAGEDLTSQKAKTLKSDELAEEDVLPEAANVERKSSIKNPTFSSLQGTPHLGDKDVHALNRTNAGPKTSIPYYRRVINSIISVKNRFLLVWISFKSILFGPTV